MKLKPIGSNQTELQLGNGVLILFSYQTPVAAKINGEFYKTEQRFSVTTTKHVNNWCHLAVTRPQAFFDNLLKGDK